MSGILGGDGRGPAIVGHRGAPRLATENTPASFAAAVEGGATWVELDARRSADGEVVVHHDPVTADGVAIIERTADELAALGVSRLDEMLAGFPGHLGVDVELKNLPGQPDFDEDQELSVLVARMVGDLDRPILVTSFNPSAITAVRDLDHQVPIGLLHVDGWALVSAVPAARDLGCVVIAPQVGTPGLDRDGVDLAHSLGLEVLVWTANGAEEWDPLIAAGVDAICTDDPGGLRAHLDGRGGATRP